MAAVIEWLRLWGTSLALGTLLLTALGLIAWFLLEGREQRPGAQHRR